MLTTDDTWLFPILYQKTVVPFSIRPTVRFFSTCEFETVESCANVQTNTADWEDRGYAAIEGRLTAVACVHGISNCSQFIIMSLSIIFQLLVGGLSPLKSDRLMKCQEYNTNIIVPTVPFAFTL